MSCKLLSKKMMVTVIFKEAPANPVPAAAVIQGGLALFLLVRCKVCDCFIW